MADIKDYNTESNPSEKKKTTRKKREPKPKDKTSVKGVSAEETARKLIAAYSALDEKDKKDKEVAERRVIEARDEIIEKVTQAVLCVFLVVIVIVGLMGFNQAPASVIDGGNPHYTTPQTTQPRNITTEYPISSPQSIGTSLIDVSGPILSMITLFAMVAVTMFLIKMLDGWRNW